MSEEPELTEEEMKEMEDVISGSYPKEEEKQNIFTYFKKIIEDKFNVKTANVTDEELGMATIPVRTNLQLSLYCKQMGMKGFSDYFLDESQIILGTSLSREGFLNKLAVTQKRESEFKTGTKPHRENKGWFKKKNKSYEEGAGGGGMT